MIFSSPGYRLIQQHYGEQTTQRSGVKLIQHIDEGIEILSRIGSDSVVMEAYAVHPIFQADVDLEANFQLCDDLHPLVVLYAMEYRHIANSFLSDKIATGPDAWGRITQYVIPGFIPPRLQVVKEMLIADKVQNRKDFLRYHHTSHKRSVELDYYFGRWLDILDISKEEYQRLSKDL